MRRNEMKAICAVLALALALGLAGCGAQAAPAKGWAAELPQRKIIIDTDAGADDASAIVLAASRPEVEILGVTVLAGNVDLDRAADNALAALELAGCDAPVFKGAAENLRGEEIEAYSVFGSDGMGDAGLIHPAGQPEETDAVDFILETLERYPGEVEIVTLGPVTNLAKAIERAPETMKKVKMIWSMGTTGLGPGNATPVAEFNVYSDPEAYQTLLESDVDITIVGLDMCGGAAQWTDAQFRELDKLGGIGRFVTASFEKLREFYAANGSEDSVMNCDTLAMTCALCPGFVKDTARYHCSCVTDPGETRGQVIFYKEGFTYDIKNDHDFAYNVTLVTEVAKEDGFALFLAAAAKAAG